MAMKTFRFGPRSGALGFRRAAIGLGAASVMALLAPASEMAVQADEQAGHSGVPRPSTLSEAADALRNAALARIVAVSPHERLPVRVLLEDLRTIAAASPHEAWVAAGLGQALLEASIGAGRAERRQLLQAGLELADAAPAAELAQALLRACCHLAESTLHSRGARPTTSGGLSGPGPAAGGQRRVLAGLHGQLERAGAGHPDSFVARSRRRATHLAPGSVGPRYVARDTSGNEVRSTDFIGTITLYRVWDANSPASIAAHRRDAELLRKYWDRPFELVGISDADDRQSHVESLPAKGFGGIQIYDGPIGTELVDALARSGQSSTANVSRALSAWHEPIAGTCILVDSRGVIRGRDLSHEELDALILDLVNEHRQLLRQREQGS